MVGCLSFTEVGNDGNALSLMDKKRDVCRKNISQFVTWLVISCTQIGDDYFLGVARLQARQRVGQKLSPH